MAAALASLASGAAPASSLFRELLPWLGLLLGLVLIGAIVITLARRSIGGSATGAAAGFTLHELRQLHATGELSDAEFERARTALLARIGSETGGTPHDRDDPRSATRASRHDPGE